ncbi:Uncharacterized protein PBTT_05530 [Plasmodiophora brassicae]|uniref:Uncharacterized protein n=1 Tax=Plasmodiophora brassicae TaxID=37360 RepID=A0A0G4IQ69_PLABS|nr:hypothetical protein PBRA_000702 [Plasmodiophora brassicae]SPQ97667.1 unnamed protein product [Plasmodiophora brassicae]
MNSDVVRCGTRQFCPCFHHINSRQRISTSKEMHLLPSTVVVILGVALAQDHAKLTMWATQTDVGGCSLPKGDYALQDAFALGDDPSLGELIYKQGNIDSPCGMVFQISCDGREPVKAIVASTNFGGGADLILSTWDKATGLSPGITYCSVSMTNENPLTASVPVCYTRAVSEGNGIIYYTKITVMNTGGRVASQVSIGGNTGSRSSGAWFQVSGQMSPSDNAAFTFTDGTTLDFALSDCLTSNEGDVQIFGGSS